jgi:hypothetical protein
MGRHRRQDHEAPSSCDQVICLGTDSPGHACGDGTGLRLRGQRNTPGPVRKSALPAHGSSLEILFREISSEQGPLGRSRGHGGPPT